MGHSRNTSAELLQRPGSRGAAAALGPSGTGDITSTLSAREQEHVARITGQPLINMTQNSNKQAPAAGLVGAIGKREREKQQMKQGINSTAVQNAIAQRQQQALYQQYPAEIAINYRQSQYGNMGQYPQQFPIQGQSQETWNSPAANVYAQGGGFSVSSPGYVAPPPGYAMPSPGYAIPMTEQREQSPSLQYPPQQQYFPPQGQGQGRGNTGFHGHGF
jgi:CCR4-NOT transcriptional complex subunit CAF120